MTESDIIKKCNEIITPMNILVIANMVREFDEKGDKCDTMLKNTTSIIYDIKLDEATIEHMKSVVIILSLYMSSHIINSLRIYPN